MAGGSLALALLAFGTGGRALSNPAQVAARQALDLSSLPLGDGKVTSAGPKKGYLYSCRSSFTGAGAQADGPWIHGSTYDLGSKYTVDGRVSWPSASFHRKIAKKLLKLTGNGLPTNHTTGAFPIAASDDAHSVDANPNSISAHRIALKLAARPKRLKSPRCVSGEVGIARNGVPIFSAVDAAGRDAVAHEVQDSCSGHPQNSGVYHYHGLPACIPSGSGEKRSKLIGWALDGFPIYGPLGKGGRYMRTSDLDVCHGETSVIRYNGVKRKLYHYHATDEFPYTVGCFRGKAVSLDTGGGGQGQGTPAPPIVASTEPR
jgi:YHYH protein